MGELARSSNNKVYCTSGKKKIVAQLPPLDSFYHHVLVWNVLRLQPLTRGARGGERPRPPRVREWRRMTFQTKSVPPFIWFYYPLIAIIFRRFLSLSLFCHLLTVSLFFPFELSPLRYPLLSFFPLPFPLPRVVGSPPSILFPPHFHSLLFPLLLSLH